MITESSKQPMGRGDDSPISEMTLGLRVVKQYKK